MPLPPWAYGSSFGDANTRVDTSKQHYVTKDLAEACGFPLWTYDKNARALVPIARISYEGQVSLKPGYQSELLLLVVRSLLGLLRTV